MVVVVMMVRGWAMMMMVMVVMARTRRRWTMVMVMVFGASPFAMIRTPLAALTPWASTFGRRSVRSAVSRIALTVLGGDTKITTFIMMMMSMSWPRSRRAGRYQIIGIWGFRFALGWSVLLAEAPWATARVRWAMRPESTFVPTAFAFV